MSEANAATDSRIEGRHKKQAKRMMRQRLRMNRLSEVVARDEGLDPRHERPIKLIGPTQATVAFDSKLNELCAAAQDRSWAAATVETCVHLGVGTGDSISSARLSAIASIETAKLEFYDAAPQELRDTRENIVDMIGEEASYWGGSMLNINLSGLSDRPFTLWGLEPRHRVALVEGNLVAIGLLDLAGLIHLARSMGFEAELTTRKEAEQQARNYNLPKRAFARWGDRLLMITPPGKETFAMGGGMMMRIMSELNTPSFVLNLFGRPV